MTGDNGSSPTWCCQCGRRQNAPLIGKLPQRKWKAKAPGAAVACYGQTRHSRLAVV